MRLVQWQNPQIAGDLNQQQPLTTTLGSWIHDPSTFRFQWQRSRINLTTPLTTYRQFVLNDTPLAYYRLDEASGLVASDSSGNGYDGTYTATGTARGIGGLIVDPDAAVTFDGSTGFASMGIPLTIGSSLLGTSWECWFRTTTPLFKYLLGQSVAPVFLGVVLNSDQTLSGATGAIAVYWADAGGHTRAAATGLAFADGNPHHLVAQYPTASTVTLYLDGQQLPLTYGPALATVPAAFGAEPQIAAWGGGFNLPATVDEFAVYGYVLSPAQIAMHYQIGTGAGWVDIPGATSTSYQPGPLDTGRYLRARVTALNTNGSSIPSFSPASGPVPGAFVISQDSVVVPDSAQVGIVSAVLSGDSVAAVDSARILIPSLPIAVSDAVTTLDIAVASSGTTGLAAPIQLRTSGGANTSILAFGASASVPASAATSPYLQFPATPPQPATLTPVIRLIIHNDSNGGTPNSGTPIQPVLLNSDNSLFNGNGGNLPLVEPGNRNLGGGTSWGTINVSVPGIPTANMKVALQNLISGDPAGFSVSVLAWTA